MHDTSREVIVLSPGVQGTMRDRRPSPATYRLASHNVGDRCLGFHMAEVQDAYESRINTYNKQVE